MSAAALKTLEKFTKIIPLLLLFLWCFGIRLVILNPHPFNFLGLFGLIYIFPLLLYRLTALFIPVQKGIQYLHKNGPANGWVVAHRFQLIYYVFEFLESGLKLIPGAYSTWLRLWGSQIGKNVYWTPHTRVGDRTMLNIGSNVFIGNATYISPHVVKPKNDQMMLFIEPVQIDSYTFIGTHCVLGPGAKLKQGKSLPAFTTLMGSKARKFDFSDVKL